MSSVEEAVVTAAKRLADACADLPADVFGAADLYQRARPEYPEALYDALVATAGLSAGDRLLEIGYATGQPHIETRHIPLIHSHFGDPHTAC